MTANKTIYKKKLSFDQLAAPMMVCFIFFLFFKNPQIAIDRIVNGLFLCANTVIPSLFPFMVISELMIASGIGDLLGRYLMRPMSFLFGISGNGACALILGMLCGFPVGTKCAVSLYDKGEISKEECERLLSFCNIPSISFTVNIVGQRIFGDSSVGWLFYAILVASSIALGMIGADKSRSLTFSRSPSRTKRQQRLSASCFVRAVEGSARSTLTICAYVVFFSSFVGVLDVVFNALNAPLMLKTLICGALEMTNGAVACEAFESPPVRGALCALFVGWSGISVHFQMLSICDGKGLRLGRYIVNKLLQGIICSVIVALFFVLK